MNEFLKVTREYLVKRYIFFICRVKYSQLSGRDLACSMNVNPNTIWKYRRIAKNYNPSPTVRKAALQCEN